LRFETHESNDVTRIIAAKKQMKNRNIENRNNFLNINCQFFKLLILKNALHKNE